MISGFEFFIARRYLRGRSRHLLSGPSAIAMGGVFVGVAAIIIVLSVENGFHKELRDRILGASPHITVSQFGYQPVVYQGEQDSLVRKIRQVPGVVEVAPFIYTKILIRAGSLVEGGVVKGVEPELERKMTQLAGSVIEGEFVLDSAGAVIGSELARSLGVFVGDEIVLFTPAAGTATPVGYLPRTKTFRVRGIFDAGMYEYNASFVFVGLRDLQQFLGIRGMVSGYEVRCAEPLDASRVARRVASVLGMPFRATDWIAQNKNLFTALRLEKVVTFIVLVLIVLVAAFNIVGMLTMMVMRKTREIGILKTIGARSPSITRIFMLVGLMIGILGTAGGAIFGFVVSWLLNRYRFVNLPGDVYFIKNLPVQMQWQDFAIVCTSALVITFVATFYPAYRAARLQPVEAIRYE
ncbi:MAG: lipoprotein-releasing ABC transporter permease subunit [candidate division WOR-3 bacterium]|uniref:Lipoprotein-releasing ABC transporter permease subunit n=2 Tax=candidate division WOR-3 bacterium TaxID=2052148 RepID=A0A7C3IIN0_UNCW3|nr:lipoprotein-releasing ABC transporter permease subunit [candidate division WOR-3 bacterium]